ncbi:Cd2bp2, partial [Symbiodinium microadriaticum]
RDALVNDLDEDEDNDDVPITVHREEVDGEEDDGKEKFNDAGEVMEPFNLRDEREGGHFDENMNYVWQKDHGEVDSWLADMDEATMEKSIGEAAAALKRKNAKRETEDTGHEVPVDVKALKLELLTHLQPGETILSTMRRLGKTGRSTKGSNKRDVVAGAPSQGDSDKRSVIISRLTEIADLLLGSGEMNIYDMTREAVELSDVHWEYRGQDGSVHGPYSSAQIAGWKAQGYFTGPTSVMIRRARFVGESGRMISEESKEGPDRKRARTAHEEVLGDFEDSDGDENEPEEHKPADDVFAVQESYTEWVSSDDIDFSDALPVDDDS